jgi:predicted dehydrogenase
MSSMTKLRCGVIGVGRMGRHHARVYSELPDVEFVGVVEPDAERAGEAVERNGGQVFASIQAMLDYGIDAVTIATPTVRHHSDARTLLAKGVACLIEKPLAPNAYEAEAMRGEAEASGSILQVGHVVRFDPVMQAIRRIENLSPRFIEMTRISPLTFRSLDVGVVLDMMIHDLDLLLMFLGQEPEEVHASAVAVVSDAEDLCNARLVFPPNAAGNRCVATVTASRLALKTERKLRLFSDSAYVSADFVKRSGTIVERSANVAQLSSVRSQLAEGLDLSDVNYLDLVHIEALDVGDEEPLRLQAEAFLQAVRSGCQPEVDAEAGSAAVRTAERIVEAAGAVGVRMFDA